MKYLNLAVCVLGTIVLLTRIVVCPIPQVDIFDAFILSVSWITLIHTIEALENADRRVERYRNKWIELHDAIRDYMELSR